MYCVCMLTPVSKAFGDFVHREAWLQLEVIWTLDSVASWTSTKIGPVAVPQMIFV